MIAINNYFLAEGTEARQINDGQQPKRSRIQYINLKDGQFVCGYILTTDFKMYICHDDYSKKIKQHICKNPKDRPDMNCLSCIHNVKREKRTIVPFFNVDTQQVEILAAKTNIMRIIYAFIDEYDDEAMTTPVVLSRSGTAKDTRYTIMPARVKPAEQLLFEKPMDIMLDNKFYQNILVIPEDDYIRKLLGIQ
ncbi:hypothetical protein LSG31_01530 [Fodinisporobacter ferrooxydans]|uniref:Uncharacterized protein n=1 Tax=Fodinisporobacter ferrooxydans TaxID=2901836 RepID=A0ABY4CSY4_9BACL|nr:hypothetical protein LSG31_01530 [Alicyclobacillaceae bacterium MYW30-H2]